MKKQNVISVIKYIVDNAIKLKDKHTDEVNASLDYVGIFSRSTEEYNDLLKIIEKMGKVIEHTPTGSVFKLHEPISTKAGDLLLVKIRIFDKTRPERGDVDFIINYSAFKKKYLPLENFSLIERKEYEMIKLKDEKFDVLVYFPNITLGQSLGLY